MILAKGTASPCERRIKGKIARETRCRPLAVSRPRGARTMRETDRLRTMGGRSVEKGFGRRSKSAVSRDHLPPTTNGEWLRCDTSTRPDFKDQHPPTTTREWLSGVSSTLPPTTTHEWLRCETRTLPDLKRILRRCPTSTTRLEQRKRAYNALWRVFASNRYFAITRQNACHRALRARLTLSGRFPRVHDDLKAEQGRRGQLDHHLPPTTKHEWLSVQTSTRPGVDGRAQGRRGRRDPLPPTTTCEWLRCQTSTRPDFKDQPLPTTKPEWLSAIWDTSASRRQSVRRTHSSAQAGDAQQAAARIAIAGHTFAERSVHARFGAIYAMLRRQWSGNPCLAGCRWADSEAQPVAFREV